MKCGDGSCECPLVNKALRFVVIDGQLQPRDETEFHNAYCISIPNKLSDPSHWGHLAWQYCNIMESIADAMELEGVEAPHPP